MKTPDSAAKVAVIGVGRMGRHHARTYRQLPQARLVAVVDPDENRGGAVADEYSCDYFPDAPALLTAHPDVSAVTIAVPTRYHAAAARPLLERRIACLIEKPLAPTVTEAKELAEFATRHKAVLMVGHTERFNPAVRAVVAMHLTPRFMEVHRVSPMTFRSLDVGVVMDMMIHDIDIVLMFAASEVVKVDAVGVAVLGEHEDIASARLEFSSGCVANITASRLALKTERRMRIFSETGYVNLDYQKRDGVMIRKAANAQALQEVRKRVAAGGDLSDLDYSKLVTVDQLAMDLPAGEKDPLTAELSSFLHAARTGQTPTIDGKAGYEAVEVAQRIVASIREHKWKGLDAGALSVK